MKNVTINVAAEFSPHPAGRFRRHGRFTGEVFRDDLLRPALAQSDHVTIDFSDVSGLRSSFLEEAFGGLVRVGVDAESLKKIDIVSDDPSHQVEILEYISKALAH